MISTTYQLERLRRATRRTKYIKALERATWIIFGTLVAGIFGALAWTYVQCLILNVF